MPHISFSELKNWNFCPFYHKLVNLEKIKGFKGNEHTAFGSAVHAVCEKSLLKEIDPPDRERVFVDTFSVEIGQLPEDVRENLNETLIEDMTNQGRNILSDFDATLQEYFGE